MKFKVLKHSVCLLHDYYTPVEVCQCVKPKLKQVFKVLNYHGNNVLNSAGEVTLYPTYSSAYYHAAKYNKEWGL